MNLLPSPKMIRINEGFLKKREFCIKNLCADRRISHALDFLDKSDNGVEFLVTNKGDTGEGYTLDIFEDRVVISGESAQGTFYGIQTLKQILENKKVPCVHIEDAPDMGYRGFYHDVTRGKVPKVSTLKRLIDILAYYKMNSFQIYVEHTFPFKEFGEDVEKFGYLTPEEIKELDDYCYERFIEFIPSIATFGHLYELLQRKEYRHLQAAKDYKCENIFWMERMKHHTIDPKSEESIEIIRSMIDQYIPYFRSDKFNICCDETFDLQNGKYKNEDTGKLYVDFVKKIAEYLTSKGKKVMMWGDIVLQYPDRIKELPDDVVFLNWDYAADPGEENVAVFKKEGVRQIVCSGIWTFEGIRRMITSTGLNITRLLDYGYKYGAEGMLNTNWGNYGHPYGIEMSVYGIIFGASKSWNKLTKTGSEFDDMINALEFKNNDTMKYLRAVESAYPDINVWNTMGICYSEFLYNKVGNTKLPEKAEVLKAREICKKVVSELEGQVWERDSYRKEIILSAECTIVASELFLKLLGYPAEDAIDMDSWMAKYRENWLCANKESELREIEKMFNYVKSV